MTKKRKTSVPVHVEAAAPVHVKVVDVERPAPVPPEPELSDEDRKLLGTCLDVVLSDVGGFTDPVTVDDCAEVRTMILSEIRKLAASIPHVGAEVYQRGREVVLSVLHRGRVAAQRIAQPLTRSV